MSTRLAADAAPDTSLTEGLAALIRAKPVTPGDLAAAALLALDALANGVAGRRTEPGRILLSWAGGRALDPGRRALVLGGLSHVLEVDDLHRASVSHPGCVVVPAVVALSGVHGRDGVAALTALLHGYEAMTRVGMALGPGHYRVWHNTATCGPFGSAMAAASLLGLDEAATVHALGNAGTQSAGLWEFLATGAMSKHLHAGRAAEAGVVAAELAALGFTGPPAILEGQAGLFAGACPDPEPAAVLRAPDAPWQVHLTSIKPWPSCRHTHPVIDAALALAEDLDGKAVAQVEAATYQAAIDVCDRPEPETEYAAKFSLQHCIAAALGEGRIGFDSFDDAARAGHAELRAKVAVRAAEPYASSYPGAWGGEVAVTLADGSRRVARREHCRGDPEAALDAEALIAKARDLLRLGAMDDAAAETLIDAALAMPEGGPVPTLPL